MPYFTFRHFRSVVLGAALVVALAVALVPPTAPVRAGQLAAHGEKHETAPLTGAMKKALELPADRYAYEVLSMRGLLKGQLGQVYRDLTPLAESGFVPDIEISYFMTYPDGHVTELQLSSFAELKDLIVGLQKRYDAFYAVMERRFPRTVREGNHGVSASAACVDAFDDGEVVNIVTEGRFFFVETKETAYMGLALEDATVVICPYGSILPLSGRLRGGVIRLGNIAGCEISLSPL